jgi:hypothetical protein
MQARPAREFNFHVEWAHEAGTETPDACLLAAHHGRWWRCMGPRFPLFGSAWQFSTDLRTLTCRRWRGGPTLSERALALDRIAGSLFLVCLVAASIWVADRTGLLPVVADSAEAATSAPAGLDPALATTPLTSAEVRLLQRKLRSLGFDPGAVDGIPGRHTLAALNTYLAAAKLETVTQVNRASVASLLE